MGDLEFGVAPSEKSANDNKVTDSMIKDAKTENPSILGGNDDGPIGFGNSNSGEPVNTKEQIESKQPSWHETYKEDDVKKYKESYDNYTKKSQELAEQRRAFEAQRAEFQKSVEGKKQESQKKTLEEFSSLDYEEQTTNLYERYTGLEQKLNEISEMTKILPKFYETMNKMNTDRIVQGIQSAVKSVDGADITVEQIEQIAQKAKEIGMPCQNQEQFMFAYNAVKNSVGKDWAKSIKNETRNETLKDIEGKKASLSALEGTPQLSSSKPKPFANEGQRYEAMLADAKKIF